MMRIRGRKKTWTNNEEKEKKKRKEKTSRKKNSADYLSRFRSLLLLILLGAFLAFSSLGAGSDERTRTPLGAHQQRILIAIKDNTAFDRTDLCFLYYTEILMSTYHQFFQSFLHSYPYVTNNKIENGEV